MDGTMLTNEPHEPQCITQKCHCDRGTNDIQTMSNENWKLQTTKPGGRMKTNK
jgi:hypothetical protein